MFLGYWVLFILDLAVVGVCGLVMVRYGRINALHPASLYFFFHLYTFTFRIFQLARGATTLFETWELKYLAVSQFEIQRASLASMGALIVMTIVWVYLARRSRFRIARSSDPQEYRPFSRRLMWMVLGITLPVGIIAFIVLRGPILLGAGDPLSDDWAMSSYVISLYQWFGISLLALIYYYGLRLSIAVPLLIYLIAGLLTFNARMMVVIPVLFVLFAVLRRDSRSWRRPGFVLSIIVTVLIFIPGKGFGPLLRQGDLAGASELLVGGLSDMRTGAHPDASFLDMTAVTMTQIDERGRFFYGGTYSPLLFLPVPRALWPDKPGLNEWRKEIQTPWRPTSQMGTITTFIGEGYANFGYFGILLYAVFLAVLTFLLYRWMVRAPYFSLANFWSLCTYAILIQVFRDGLISFVIYHVTLFIPLSLITLLHLFALRRRTGPNSQSARWYTIFDRPNAYIDPTGKSRVMTLRT